MNFCIRYLVLELCAASLDRHFLPDGNVDKYMGPLPESQLQMLYEIASGLAYIHAPIHGRDQTGLQHRDIKPQNILFSLGTDPVRMKVADFGCVKAATQTGSASWSFNHGGGPEDWRSPEMINWEREDQKARAEGKPGPPRARLTNKTDVFSAGLVFFAILTNGLHPFGSGQMLTSNIHEGRRVNFNGNITCHPLLLFKNLFQRIQLLNWSIHRTSRFKSQGDHWRDAGPTSKSKTNNGTNPEPT